MKTALEGDGNVESDDGDNDNNNDHIINKIDKVNANDDV